MSRVAPATSSSSSTPESCDVEAVDTRVSCSRFNCVETRSNRVFVKRNSGDAGASATKRCRG